MSVKLEGKVFKKGKFWLAEISSLDYLTQGRSKKDALAMAADIVESGVGKAGFKVSIFQCKGGEFVLEADDTRMLVAHMLKRLRQKSGLSVRQVSERLNSRSTSAYGVYEQGKAVPTLEKLEQLVATLDPGRSLVLRVK